MYLFNAVKKKNKIKITSNTYWSCNVYGNFMLSKNNGSGNGTIDIIIPKELAYVSGSIIFSYGDERCKYPELEIYEINDCYIKTIPDFQVCNGENVIVIPYKKLYETNTVKIISNGIWKVSEANDCGLITNVDELIIYPTSSINPYVKIKPNTGCDNFIIIKMKKTE